MPATAQRKQRLSPSLGWSLRCAYRLRLAVAAARQADTQTTIAIIHEAERRGLSSNELLAVAEQGWPPTPAAYPSPAGGQRWVVGCARWGWTHRPRRQAVGLVQQERQL
jgi:hypothetical protein